MPWGEVPRGEFPGDGLVVVDKNQGVTSHDVVGVMRRLAGTRKVGHAGTLDPMATGVLCVGIGRATKLLQYVTGTRKEYTATIRFGCETSTEDAEGEVTAAVGCSAIDAVALESVMRTLTGYIRQIPSSVSALKIDGRRAYDLVREGIEVQLEARPIVVEEFSALGEPRSATQAVGEETVEVMDLDVRVVCSAGTYVRALVRDLGAALGCGAHLTALRRTRVGQWGEDIALTVRDHADRLEEGESLAIVPLAELCRGLFAAVEVSTEEGADLAMGRFIASRPWGEAPAGAGSAGDGVGVAWCGETPVALVSVKQGKIKPDLLLAGR